MKQIIMYRVISTRDLGQLNLKVNNNLKDGWQPLGGVATSILPITRKAKMQVTDIDDGCRYLHTQVLVRYEP